MEKVTITNPKKNLFASPAISKKSLVDYYEMAAPYILPYLKDRPITLHRFPDGIEENGFWQKEAPEHYPDYIERVMVADRNETKPYAMINNLPSLLYVANLASIPLHTWQSRKGSLEYPDQIIFDLDPSDGDFKKVKTGALELRNVLRELKIEPYVKTTGSKGLHLAFSIAPKYTYDEVKQFCQQVAQYITEQLPDLFTTAFYKKERGDRIFADYLRNQYGHTAVAPYAVRPLPGAPVAAPILWEELKGIETSQKFTIRNMKKRLKDKGDVWEGLYENTQDISHAMESLENMLKMK